MGMRYEAPGMPHCSRSILVPVIPWNNELWKGINEDFEAEARFYVVNITHMMNILLLGGDSGASSITR
jgi:hypothetical protein